MSKYWQKRFEILEEKRNQTARETVQSIIPSFNQAQAQIEKEINAWYSRFADNNQISLVEAKKLLNTKELKEFRWDVQEYIKYGRENAIDQKWMKELENASARFHISRLEALKIRTQNAAERAFGNELDALDEMAARIYMNDYYHTAYEIQKGLGVGFDVSKIDQRKLDSIISKPWTTDKMTFSDRIWKQKTQLLDSLHTELTQMCILGRDPDQAVNNIAKRMNVSKGQAGRLVMTEAAYFGSVAQKDCFNDLDVEKYEVIATLDNRTSEVCQKMDGQVFDMKDFQAGVTAPPFHCWCRSCTAPWFEDNDDGTRVARDADGKIYEVPASMKYQDWKQCFVDKTKDPADWLKAISAEDVVEAVKKFVPAKTIEEAEEYASRFVLSHKTKYSGFVDYGNIDVSVANDINETITEIFDAYEPPPMTTIQLMNMREKKWQMAQAEAAYGFTSGDLYINGKYYKNAKTIAAHKKEYDEVLERVMPKVSGAIKQLEGKTDAASIRKRKYYQALLDTGRTNVIDVDIKGSIIHELGHMLDAQIFGLQKTKSTFDIKGSMEKYANKISAYATDSTMEYVAESFSAYWKGEKDILDPELVEIFEGKRKK